MGLSGFASMMRGDELINALAKVKSFIPAEKAKEIEIKANQVFIDLNPWTGNRHIQGYLEIIKTALLDSKLLSFDYTDRFGKKRARIAESYQLVFKRNHWYFQAYCLNREDFRLFKLSRISDMQILEDYFTPRDYQKPQLNFTDILETIQKKLKFASISPSWTGYQIFALMNNFLL